MVSLPTLQNDVTFLTDSAEIMLEIFQRGGSKPTHQSVLTSCTWALANLSDSLAKHHQQRELDDLFPPYLVLQLMQIAINMSFATNNHMNMRSNSVRSLVSFNCTFEKGYMFLNWFDFTGKLDAMPQRYDYLCWSRSLSRGW